ncbi:MAG: DNA-directed RNA polymerase [Candidatus Woesearchaeota archaeon]
MFYSMQIRDHVRVPPEMFNLHVQEAVLQCVRKEYEGHISKELGIVIDVADVKDIGEGIIVPGDGASYFSTTFEMLTFKPELQEVLLGGIRDIADFGAFMNLGPIDGMIHISQTMDDFVSFSKEKALLGKESKKSLKIGDKCMARVIAVSFKDQTNPKIGLTMRQLGLGRLDWITEEKK